LITPDWDSATLLGQKILEAETDLALRNALWRETMFQLELGPPDQPVSHPYRIMLRLVSDFPGIERRNLLLALEASDDSREEYLRISALAPLTVDEIRSALNITEYVAANAVKILPSIAVRVGDIVLVGTKIYLKRKLLSSEDEIVDDAVEDASPVEPTSVTAETISPIPNFGESSVGSFDLANAIATRKARTVVHHNTVTSVAGQLTSFGYTLHANPYDCLGFKTSTGGVLVEVKTLDGSSPDERRQSAKALGQLRGYRFFNVHPQLKLPRLAEVVAYSHPPSSDTREFLKDNSVCTAWPDNDQWFAADLSGNIANFCPDGLLDG
jgi:hypothetical protein